MAAGAAPYYNDIISIGDLLPLNTVSSPFMFPEINSALWSYAKGPNECFQIKVHEPVNSYCNYSHYIILSLACVPVLSYIYIWEPKHEIKCKSTWKGWRFTRWMQREIKFKSRTEMTDRNGNDPLPLQVRRPRDLPTHRPAACMKHIHTPLQDVQTCSISHIRCVGCPLCLEWFIHVSCNNIPAQTLQCCMCSVAFSDKEQKNELSPFIHSATTLGKSWGYCWNHLSCPFLSHVTTNICAETATEIQSHCCLGLN